MMQMSTAMKEHMMSRSTTKEGVFPLVAFSWEGMKMWLKMMRKMRNRIQEIPATAAIQSGLSSPVIAWFEDLMSKFTVCTREDSYSSASLTVTPDCSSWVTYTFTFRWHFSTGWLKIRGEIEFNRHISWTFLTANISCILGRNLYRPLFCAATSSCKMLRNGVIPIPPATRSRLSNLHKISNL